MKLITPIQFALPMSAKQMAIANAIDAGKSVSVDACAGSGKTHTANYCTYNYSERVELIPFAKSLRLEQTEKFSQLSHVNVSNFHQRGNRMCRARKVDEKKVINIAKNLFDKSGLKVAELTKYLKVEGYGIYKDAMTVDAIATKYGIRISESEEDACGMSIDEMAIKVLEASDADTDTIDFEDQLRFPVLYNKSAMLPKDCLVVLDEVQDFSPNAFCFVTNCLVSPSHQVLMIGDPSRQALMQFAGASVELFNIMSDYFGCVRMELDENRRCAKAIVNAAPYKGNMVALEDAPEGVVESMSEADVIASICDGMHPHDAVLSETNAPILKLGIKLITSGVPVRMRTNKLESLLFRYAYKHIVNRNMKVGEMSIALRDELAERVEDGGNVSEFADFIKCIEALEVYCLSNGILKSGYKNRRPVHPLQQALEILTSGTEGITLMTGHTSKGLEWNTVFHLPTAQKAAEQDWQAHQNQCLAHVIATRAKMRFVTLQDGE